MLNTMESIPEVSNKIEGTIPFSIRKSWANCVGNQIVKPLRYYEPKTLVQLHKILHLAYIKNCRVKAVGSGHSFTNITQTNDFLIDCKGMNKPIKLEKKLLKEDVDVTYLEQVENGITIKSLNEYLDSRNKALMNMGSYDAQTIVGAACTSTHGSGFELGPIASSIKSIIMVGEKGQIYRIEPQNGITDPGKYKEQYPYNNLIQDDDCFNAVLISMGCMGVIYSVILQVRSSYYLEEERLGKLNEVDWKDVKKIICEEAVFSETEPNYLESNRHFEVYINPYKVNGKNNCLITRRNIPQQIPGHLPLGKRSRKWFLELIAKPLEFVFRWWFIAFPYHAPTLIKIAMNQLIDKDGYTQKSYFVLNLGAANFIKGYAAEFALSLKGDKHIKAIDTILDLAEKKRQLGKICHSSPLGVRFVAKSDGLLSMFYGEAKCTIEVPILLDTQAGFETLNRIEDELKPLGARPHWGQWNHLNNERIQELYPSFDKWKEVFNEMNKHKTFHNLFTESCEL